MTGRTLDIERFRIAEGQTVKLGDIATGVPRDLGLAKWDGKELLEGGRDTLRDLQERLHAEGRWALLVVLQGMDASGKDGVVEHVLSGVNPQGCRIASFSAPTPSELRHDFLWRHACALPARGEIGLFVRSHYEEVLVARIHRDILDKQKLPAACVSEDIWAGRFESIRGFERHLVRNGTAVLKFFLHMSPDEQKRRLLSRIEEPDKNWKFDAFDLVERQHWADYAAAYGEAIAATTGADTPWYVVPADQKWFARLVVSQTIIATLERIDPKFPRVDDDTRAALHRAKAQLGKE